MTTLVLLPGMMCDRRLFAPQVEALGSTCSILHFGLDETDSIGGLAGNILKQCPDHFALAGLSMGGIVAMHMAGLAPERIERLALLDTNALADPPETIAVRNRQIEAVRAGKLIDIMRDELKPNYLADSENRGAILDLCMDMARSLGAEVFVRQAIALRDREDQRKNLSGFSAPTMVIRGEEDTLCSLEKHQIIVDQIKGSTLEIIPDAGHLPTLENPEATNKVLEKWLEMK